MDGAGLVLWPNAMHCLAALGVEEAVRSRATALTGSTIRRADGRLLARMTLDPRTVQGQPPLGLVRAHLVEALAAALRPGVLRLGAEITGAELRAEVADADLVVGADGVGSLVRGEVEPGVRPTHRGYTVWRALVPASVASLGGAPQLVETWGAGMRFGMVPAGPGMTYVYAAAPAPEGERSDDELAELRSRYADWHTPIPRVLGVVDPATFLRHDIHDLPPGRTRLHRGRVVLLGDAGHAMEPNLGQGAGLAIEDAVVLAHSLSVAPSVEDALATFSAVRAPRVSALARQSRQVGRLARLERPLAVALRDLAVLTTPDRLSRRASSRLAGWRPPTMTLPTPEETR